MEINGVGFKPSDIDAGGAQSLADNFDTFLALLTTQLQNQDPLDPLKSEQFTEQLVQFTGVEQAIATNKRLDKLLDLQAANQLNGAVGYIGKTAEFSSDQLMLANGTADISYELDGNAAQTTINIVNSAGLVVRSIPGQTTAGRHTFTWDGTNGAGSQLTDGVYSFSVISVDRNGNTVKTETAAASKVTGVEIDDGVATLTIGQLGGVSFDRILAIREN